MQFIGKVKTIEKKPPIESHLSFWQSGVGLSKEETLQAENEKPSSQKISTTML